MNNNGDLNLKFGIEFSDLYHHDGLVKLDNAYMEYLKDSSLDQYNQLLTLRGNPDEANSEQNTKDTSNFLIELAQSVEDFIAELFDITAELTELKREHNELAVIFICKRQFIQRKAAKAYKPDIAQEIDGAEVTKAVEDILGVSYNDISYSLTVIELLAIKKDEDGFEDAKAKLDILAKYACWALYHPDGRAKHGKGVLFQIPKKLDNDNLVPLEHEIIGGVRVLKSHHIRYRDGFSLTDDGGTLAEALSEANYCIWCHNQGKDSCSKGLKDKEGNYKTNELRIKQAGCPLEEKISEFHKLKSDGFPLGALAMIAVDNPMCAGTGHRICNDCMKSCIYQKQDPVNIPKAETKTLKDILELPWGFEIYSLLSRWNPLNLARPLPKAESGYKVLIAGLGPAGYTLAHHLLNDGHLVVGVDGLKIEPLDENISGVAANGERRAFRPIKDINSELYEDLGSRNLAGFGGVAEYGITVRWDKNYLKVIRLLLERRAHFAMYGGVRFGSSLDIENAFADYGFDHIALCMGAGKPTTINMPNGLARGVRTASDFLMSLQLTGAAKMDSITNLQLRLPAVVVGGGLTAIDTATESMAYYVLQVEKFLRRYEELVSKYGEDKVRARWSEEEAEIAAEFIAHAYEIRKEKELAKQEARNPAIAALIQSWGGVKLVYRKRLQDSPAYRLNHEEVELAMEEGIYFAENLSPVAIEIDEREAAKAITFERTDISDEQIDDKDKIVTMPAKSILLAIGTNPNTVIAREELQTEFAYEGKYFAPFDMEGNQHSAVWSSKPQQPHVIAAFERDGKAKGRAISYFGDLHPDFAGNVVKAMGSAKQGYPIISNFLSKYQPLSSENGQDFVAKLNKELLAVIHKVNRLTPTITEVVVKAPLAARKFEPGQFYRLQNYEHNALYNQANGHSTRFAMEGLALTGAWVDKEQGLMSTIVLEMGGSSDLCAYLKEGESISLMGPTGEPTEIPNGETVLLAGGGLGNAVLFSIGKALRAAGSKVLYFAGYKKAIDRYKIEEIEAAADVVIWACDEEADFTPNPERPQDKSYIGNIVKAMVAYQEGELGDKSIDLTEINRVIAIGSDRMMRAVKEARCGVLAPYLRKDHQAIGSINSPMQCMMKEICAQCLQRHIDPATGEEYYVYSCYNQDQPLDNVDFSHLNTRLAQNVLGEKLTALWIDDQLAEMGVRDKRFL